MDTERKTPESSTSGFTLVEVIVAVVILAFGLLGMAGTTAAVVRQLTLADVTTERSTALQTTIERLKGIPYDSIVSSSDSVGAYQVSWTVWQASQWKVVSIVTVGPGMSAADGGFPVLNRSVADTFTYRVLNP